jgi:hypothetical protein
MQKYTVRKDIPKEIQNNLKKYSELTKKLLFYREIKTLKKQKNFLNPVYENNNDPFLYWVWTLLWKEFLVLLKIMKKF